MEVTIANRHGNSFDFAKPKKDKDEFKRNIEFSINVTKEAMSIFKVELVQITGRSKLEEKRSMPFKGATRKRLMLK